MCRSPQSPEPRSRDEEVPNEAAPGTSPNTPPNTSPDTSEASADYVDGIPTFDFVRDRIEGRYATAAGGAELAEETAAGRSVAQQHEDRDAAARERLEQIRRSLREE